MTPKNKLISAVVLGLALFFIASLWQASLSEDDAGFIVLGKLSFYTSVDPGINESKNQSKPVFLYFRSETCYWCVRFEEEALSDTRVIDILNRDFILISVDIFKQKNVAANLNVRSTPYMIFFTKDGEEIMRIPGYLPTDEFMVKLNEARQKAGFTQAS